MPKKGYKQSKEHKEKRTLNGSNTRIERYGNSFGPTAGWNKGLTSQNDERIKKASEKVIETKNRRYGNSFGPGINWNKGLTKENNASLKRISDLKTGVKRTEDVKNKVRESVIRWRLNNNPYRFHFIGKNEKILLDQQEIKDGCKILRQFQVGKFVVDGYCPETNTVYEVYEKHHQKKVEYDKERQEKIQRKLNCSFIIIEDTNK